MGASRTQGGGECEIRVGGGGACWEVLPTGPGPRGGDPTAEPAAGTRAVPRPILENSQWEEEGGPGPEKRVSVVTSTGDPPPRRAQQGARVPSRTGVTGDPGSLAMGGGAGVQVQSPVASGKARPWRTAGRPFPGSLLRLIRASDQLISWGLAYFRGEVGPPAGWREVSSDPSRHILCTPGGAAALGVLRPVVFFFFF